jgi:hypothetical protein
MSNIFRGQAPGPPFKGKRRERRDRKGRKGGKGKRGEGRKGEGRGWEGRKNPQIKFYDYSTGCRIWDVCNSLNSTICLLMNIDETVDAPVKAKQKF